MRAPPARLLQAALVFAALLQPACKRTTGESPHYTAAADIHGKLYVRLLDEAYLDPRMDEVESELRQVEATSLSYQNAQALLAQIAKGRADALAARDARAKAQAEAERLRQSALAASASLVPTAAPATPPPAAPAPTSTPDATPAAPPDPYGPGASIAALNQSSGGCLLPEGTFNEGERITGTTYLLADVYACKEKLPGFVGQVALVVEGRIYRRVPASLLKRAQVPVPGGEAADGGAPASAPTPPAGATGSNGGQSPM